MPTAIEFNNISKIYRLGLVSTGTLAHDLHRWWTMNIRGKEDPYLTIGETNDRSTKGSSDYVWALKDIDFKVEQGDVVGIIGKNGAGKSTLLKILSKVTAPTTGSIRARGRIGSLLEVGTGFHPEMTGRENIYMNGAILGMSKQEITKKLDEIIDFSGCERYIDTPVKRYSSGMMVRLGFAVAAHLDPEILVVDEVLAVGDAEFQKKAIGKMQDVSLGEGRTVLFVSHNMAAVRRLCHRGILLNNGSIKAQGSIETIVDSYLATASKLPSQRLFAIYDAPGCKEIKISRIAIVDTDGNTISHQLIDKKIGICVEYHVLQETQTFIHGINIFNSAGDHIFTSHDNTHNRAESIQKGKYRTIAWIPENILQPGQYRVSFACMRYSPFRILFHELDLIQFEIIEPATCITRNPMYDGPLPGIVRPSILWEETKQL